MNQIEKKHRVLNWSNTAWAVAAFFLWCVLLLWSWNTIGPGLFNLPIAKFKHAVAAGLLLICFFLPLLMIARKFVGKAKSENRSRA